MSHAKGAGETPIARMTDEGETRTEKHAVKNKRQVSRMTR